MLRGFSRGAMRSKRKRLMRRATCGSSCPICRVARGPSSIDHAIFLHHFLKRNRLDAARVNVGKFLLGHVNVLKIVKMFENCLTGIEGLGPAGFLCQSVETFFNLFGETNCEHDGTSSGYAIQV